MVTRNEAFPTRFFKAPDIPSEGLPLKIAKVEQEKVGPDQELKWVVYFKGQDKQLILNGTNWDLIAAALHEEDSDDWIGKTIELFPTQRWAAAYTHLHRFYFLEHGNHLPLVFTAAMCGVRR